MNITFAAPKPANEPTSCSHGLSLAIDCPHCEKENKNYEKECRDRGLPAIHLTKLQ
jgi:hypothetical protein